MAGKRRKDGKTKTILFVGCGTGEEIENADFDQNVFIIGLEPYEPHYKKTVERFKENKNIQIVCKTLSQYCRSCQEHKFHEIYCVFPTPAFILPDHYAEAIDYLLAEDGHTYLYTEIIPEIMQGETRDVLRLQIFFQQIHQYGMYARREIKRKNDLPVMVQKSGCGSYFIEQRIEPFLEAVIGRDFIPNHFFNRES